MDKVQGIISSAIGRRAAEDAQNARKAKLQKTKKPRTSPSSLARSAARGAGKKASQRGHRGICIKQNPSGSDCAGLIGYAQIESKNHEVISSNCDDAQSFIATTNLLAKQLEKRGKKIKHVGHVTLSLPADTNFNHDNWAELVDDVRESLGLDDSFPYFFVRHFDTPNTHHGHLVFSRISITGKIHDQSNLGLRCASAEQLVEQKYNLNLHPMRKDVQVKPASKGEIEMQLRTAELSTRAKFQTICIDAMRHCDNIVTYFNRLQAAGFDLEITTQDNGERISGIVYHLNGDTMKASDLGKAFTFNGLTKKAGLSYDKNRDFESITKIQNATAIKQFRAAGGDLTIDQLSVSGGHGASITASSVGNEPISSVTSSNRTDIGNRDGQRHAENKRDEPNSERVQRAPASQPTAIKPDLGDSNPSYQRASDLISDLADATSIATNYKREGVGAANQRPATSSNAAAQIAQIKAFGRIELQLSIMLPPKPDGSRPMLKRDFNASTWDKFKGFATAKNAQGGDIYIAPHPDAEHGFILLDDLTIDSVNQMKLDGLEPAIIVESSPMNFQAWVKLSDKLTKEQRLEASRLLTKKYEADGAAVGSVRIGRVAGFTNRKPKHKNAQGLQPYCKLTANPREEPATNGHLIVEQANELIANGTASTERKKRFSAIENARDYLGYGANSVQFFQTEAKKIFNRYKDETDVSKLDSMVCKTMVQHHFSDVQIAHALREASPDLATRHSVEDYIARTVSYARNYIEMQRQLQESEDAATDDHTL